MAGHFPSYRVRFQVLSFEFTVYPKANLWWSLASLVLILGLGLFFRFLFHTKENKLLLSFTCVETSEWSEEQNRDCYCLYKDHLHARSELKMKMSVA